MKKNPQKHDIRPEQRSSIWQIWMQNLKEWIWYHQEHPDWYDIDIQGTIVTHIIAPIKRLLAELTVLGRERRLHKMPETESRVGQLLLFAWGSLPRLGSSFRERLERRRKSSIRTSGQRRSFFEHLHVNPAGFLVGALGIALTAVLLSLYTLGTSAIYDGVDLGTVSSAKDVQLAVSQVETVTREALGDESYTVDTALLQTATRVVPRTDVESSEELEDKLNSLLGLVAYGYTLYVDEEPVAATTFPGALEELLEQLKVGYRTESTVECDFVEKVEIREGYVDRSYMMNLGNIAEILNDTKEGAVTYKVKSGDSFYGIAAAHGLTVSALRRMNPGYSSLYPGDILTVSNAVPYLTVLNVERQNYVQNVPYTVEYTDDSSMYQGDYEVLSKGQYGKADISANVTYVNGEEIEREIVATATLLEPVAELQARGTKVRPTWYPTGSFRWPTSGVITSYFGYRNSPTAGASSNHGALDVANRTGTAIYAADGGTVTYAGWSGGLGYMVEITHNNTGFVTIYAHCSALYVSTGDHVYKGEHIAAMGSTGISTGSHLHFAMKKNGTYVDPLNYLP